MEDKIKGCFFSGNYKEILQNVSDKSHPFLLRTLVELGQINSVQCEDASFKLLASYLEGGSDANTIRSQLPDHPIGNLFRYIISMNEGDSSFVIDNMKPDSFESLSLMVCALLNIRRPEVAEAMIKEGKKSADEEVLLDLGMAWTHIVKGEYDEANGYFNEVLSTYGDSPLLLNGLAVCALQDANYPEAEHLLGKALSIAQEVNSRQDIGTSLKNMITLKRLTGEDPRELEAQLQQVCPQHEYFKTMQKASDLFDQLIA